ncbi:MAG TPA: hypothetical protein EYP35_00510 [Desulfobacterales bacterium]|nr:hypothetical protein [Desulfobacterales bacterium]HIP38608.1 hypothetical protein [Desulfocapsa sulfexigens]
MKNFFFMLLLLIMSLVSSVPALAVSDTSPGVLRSYSTIHSLGFEWDISGDDNHDASCLLHFRRQGEDTWKEALPLYRVDYVQNDPVDFVDPWGLDITQVSDLLNVQSQRNYSAITFVLFVSYQLQCS